MKSLSIANVPTLDFDVGLHGSVHLDSPIDPITVGIAVGIAIGIAIAVSDQAAL